MSKVSENTAKTSTIAVLRKTEFLGKTLTVFGTVATPLFLAKEVAELLEHSDTHKLVACVDVDEKERNIIPTLGGKQKCWFLTEYGLYEVLMQSRKPIAKEFKKGVKAILKEIRQQGYYVAPSMTAATDCFGDDYKAKHIAFLNGLIEHKDKQMLRLLDVMNDMSLQIKDLKAANAAAPASAPKPLPFPDAVRILGKSELLGCPVTVFGTKDNPLFTPKEIADLFGIKTPKTMLNYVSDGNKQKLYNPTRIFGGMPTWFINKAGLDELAYRYAYCGGVVDAEKFDNDIHNLLQTIHSK